ncbi:MAG: restriction endonuclease subunit S [Elusimicrobiota bacterium]|jgi:type I restriction enzyme S subunit|nr:restriction endonuclease subunit S [Elusimicrobiota bacterium]
MDKELTQVKLEYICEFRNGKIKTNSLNLNTYISTENMLPEKFGITTSAGLPTTQFTQEFCKNDVLISNIRPYFKKIWYAKQNGGCSNDVLIFKVKENYYPKFLYYVLSEDKFFDYATSTSKGTKMPRGDKNAILQYLAPNLSLSTQQAIAATLSCLDNKIELNNKINANLEAQAQAIFKNWFVDFEPFQCGKFVDSELGKIPEEWKIISFSKFITERNEKSNDQTIPEYSVTNTGIYPRDDKFKKKLSAITSKNKLAYNTDMVFGMSREILNWGMMKEDIGGFSSAYHIYKVADNIHPLFLESFIKFHSSYFKDLIKPASREGQGVDKSVLFSKSVYFPPNDILEEYYTVGRSLLEHTMINNQQSRALAAIRDALLPKLMNGDIEVGEEIYE